MMPPRAMENLIMERHAPQLIVAQILVRESQQRFREEQMREHLHGPDRTLPTRNDRLRMVIAGALIRLGERLDGTSTGGDGVIPAAATGSDRNISIR